VSIDPGDLRSWRLPRGRHGLPREIVKGSQRERLLVAVVQITAEKGYDGTTVADILGEAGVGRESFYELFADRCDCVLAAHALLIDDLEETMRSAYEAPGEWVERFRAALAATLEWFASDRAAARFTLIEVGAVGPAFRARFENAFTRFVAILEDGMPADVPRPEPLSGASLAVGAMLARIYREVAIDRAADLPSLLPELTYELLVPFFGEAPAAQWADGTKT
jgi:AcrR family transcriptional regulator